MKAYRFEETNPSMEALMMERAMKVIKYHNLFILVERNFVKQLIKKENYSWLIMYKK
jgi:hypothetical protein